MAAELTDEQKKAYIEGKGLRCPFCRSEGIEGGSVEIDGGTASQKISCLSCDEEWVDIYTLTGVEAA